MSKYNKLWNYVQERNEDNFKMTFDEIEEAAGLPIDHSFLKFKKELLDYGYASGNDSMALGIVTAVMGIGGIIGGVIVSAGKGSKDNIKMIYISAALSFLFGDLLMAMGRNVVACPLLFQKVC